MKKLYDTFELKSKDFDVIKKLIIFSHRPIKVDIDMCLLIK